MVLIFFGAFIMLIVHVYFLLSIFTKALSQKIGSIHFAENRKSHDMVYACNSANPAVSSPKFKTGRVVAIKTLDSDEHYNENR